MFERTFKLVGAVIASLLVWAAIFVVVAGIVMYAYVIFVD